MFGHICIYYNFTANKKIKNMRIENTIPVLNANIDYSLEERYLRAWGSWYAMENRIDDLGYPKSAAFTKERVDGDRGGYFHGDEDINSIPRKIDKILADKPVFKHIAECEYVFMKDYPVKIKSDWIHGRSKLYLGSSQSSREKKYSSLKLQVMSYIMGSVKNSGLF